MLFPDNSQRTFTSHAICLCGHDGSELPELLRRTPAVYSEQDTHWGVDGSGQGFFLSSFKAPASCSKFLMTTFHLKSSSALKEASFDSTVSQDNLARKQSDEFSILYSFQVGNKQEKKNVIRNKNRKGTSQSIGVKPSAG